MNRKHMQMWYASLGFFALTLLLFVYYLLHHSARNMIFCLTVLGIGSFLFWYSSKKLSFPAGYTLPQALLFYKKCAAAGMKKPATFCERQQEALVIAAKYDFSKALTEQELLKLYSIGRNYALYKKITR